MRTVYIYCDLNIYMDIPLSNEDITRLLNGKCNIVLYPSIRNYSSLDELLRPYNACVILFQTKPSYGHWVCITKHGKDVEFFNSYGGYPDDSLSYIDKKYASGSNQDYPYLTKLFIESPYELFYNEFAFQKKDKNVKTCGRHCVVRIMHKTIDIYEYKYILDSMCKEFNTNYDGLVTMITRQ
jgi:hypothetical protein